MTKLNINRVSIWIDAGKPYCSGGSIEEVIHLVQESIVQAEAWIEAAETVARRNDIYRERSPEDEKYISDTMKKFGGDRANALQTLKSARDIGDL